VSPEFLARDFFDLQFSFAEKARDLSGMSLEAALLDYTNFYVRFGLGRDFDPAHAGWKSYRAGLRDAEDPRQFTYRFYLRQPESANAPPVVATFGCFSYGLPDATHVRLHFRNAEAGDASPLGSARVDRRRAELAALFAHARKVVSQDTPVVGRSWLYNLRAYRRLFPQGYVSTARPIRGGFRSMALWGQFLDRRGEVRASMSEPFLKALGESSTLDDLGESFPFHALSVTAPVRLFREFYEA
jgi:hypothetical protein